MTHELIIPCSHLTCVDHISMEDWGPDIHNFVYYCPIHTMSGFEVRKIGRMVEYMYPEMVRNNLPSDVRDLMAERILNFIRNQGKESTSVTSPTE